MCCCFGSICSIFGAHNVIELPKQQGGNYSSFVVNCDVRPKLKEKLKIKSFNNKQTNKETFLFQNFPHFSPLRNEKILFDSALYDSLSSSAGDSIHPFTYITSDDCMTGNHGHCIADTHSLLMMQRILGFSRNETKVMFYSGFGRNKYGFYYSDLLVPQFKDWWPFVRPENANEDVEVFAKISVMGLVLPECRDFSYWNLTSQVLFDASKQIELFWGLQSIDLSQDRIASGKTNILWLVRSHYRIVKSLNKAISAIKNTYKDATIISALDFGKLSYTSQMKGKKWADIIIDMHSSAFQAFRLVISKQQISIIEITPMKCPGSYCQYAKVIGVPYYYSKCKRCDPPTWNGKVDITHIVSFVGDILNPSIESEATRLNINCLNDS